MSADRARIPSIRANLGVWVLLVLATRPAGADDVPVATSRFEGRLIVSQLPRSRPGRVTGGQRHSFTAWYPDGSRLVRVDVDASSPTRVVSLTAGFAAARDPEVDSTGTEVLFSAKRTSGTCWQVWRMSVDGDSVEAVFQRPFDCLGPRYLPNGLISFFAPTEHYEEDGPLPATALWIGDPEDSSVQRVTFNPSSDFKPLVLPDGRVLFSSWRHHGTYHGLHGVFSLATAQWDGCGVWTFDDEHDPKGVRVPTAVASDGTVFCVRFPSLRAIDAEGILAFDPGDPYAGQKDVVAGNDFGSYRSVQPVGKDLLVTGCPRGGESHGVYQLSAGGHAPTIIYDDPRYDETDIALVAPRRKPLARFPGSDDEEETGLLFCQDIYRSSIHRIARGRVHRVRILEGVPISKGPQNSRRYSPEGAPLDLRGTTTDSATGFLPKRILGEVAPAADGSFCVRVPADRPLHIQLVDRRGVALVTQATWFWVRSGERRGCIGCHEDRETSVRNRFSLAVDAGPVDLSPPAGHRTVDFRRDIRPVLQRNCAVESCHSGVEPTADLNLKLSENPSWHETDTGSIEGGLYDPVYTTLLRPQKNKPPTVGAALVHPGVARDSPLVWMIFGKKLGRSYRPAPFRRPIGREHPEKEIPPEDLRLIAEWVDLGAPWDSIPGPDSWSFPVVEETACSSESPASTAEHDDRRNSP